MSKHVRRIAAELYRFDRRDVGADFDALPPVVQETYLATATATALLNDQERLRPAIYDAAEQLTPAGLTNFTRQQRAEVVKGFIRAFQVFRDHLAGKRHPDTVDLMRALVQKDLASLTPPAPVAHAGVDLANLEPATTEVM